MGRAKTRTWVTRFCTASGCEPVGPWPTAMDNYSMQSHLNAATCRDPCDASFSNPEVTPVQPQRVDGWPERHTVTIESPDGLSNGVQIEMNLMASSAGAGEYCPFWLLDRTDEV